MPAAAENERRGGPPYWWYVDAGPGGQYRAIVRHGDTSCRTIDVGAAGEVRRDAGPGVWRVTREWSRATENLYSAWIEKLFDAPLDEDPTWRALHEITRDPERNFLHDHLGLGEDDARGLRLEPDCADLPYFLRAYFAVLWLPFGCSGAPAATAASRRTAGAGTELDADGRTARRSSACRASSSGRSVRPPSPGPAAHRVTTTGPISIPRGSAGIRFVPAPSTRIRTDTCSSW
jgi:hypothetical protein